MTSIYLAEETPVVDYSQILESFFLNLRKELRTDLSDISNIDWDEEVKQSSKSNGQVKSDKIPS